MKRIIVLGATGSIGASTIDVIRSHRDRFLPVGFSAHTRKDALDQLANEFPGSRTVLTGADGDERLIEMIAELGADIVVNGIAGAAGLAPSVAAIESGKDLALANKETIVMAGPLIRTSAQTHGARIIPVDSEHAALFYLLEDRSPDTIDRLVLTASGGAFRDLPLPELESVSVASALTHPTWQMGPKITIDSATMANKGLEVIEAVQLFSLPEERIEVVIHRESTVHGMIRTTDGSFYAQLSRPDMRVPIQHALTYPEELPCRFGALDFDGLTLTFSHPDPDRYPALGIAREAARLGGAYTIAYNAANEVAVEGFLDGRIGFTDISTCVEESLARGWEKLVPSYDQVYRTDAEVRRVAESIIAARSNP